MPTAKRERTMRECTDILVSLKVWRRALRWVVSPEDSPDDVLRRVLDAAEKNRPKTQAIPLDRLWPPLWPTDYPTEEERRRCETRLPRAVIDVLEDLGGSARVDKVLGGVEGRIAPIPRYYREPESDGVERWVKLVRSTRSKLIADGVLKKGSPRGTWELEPDAPTWRYR